MLDILKSMIKTPWEHRLGMKLPRGQLLRKPNFVLSRFDYLLGVCTPRHMDEGKVRNGRKLSGLHAPVQEEAPCFEVGFCVAA